jgi:hypothetical protein
MKKILLVILAVMFVGFLYFAVKQPTTPVNEVISRPVEVKTTKGDVEVKVPQSEVVAKTPKSEVVVKTPKVGVEVKTPKSEVVVKTPKVGVEVKTPKSEVVVKTPKVGVEVQTFKGKIESLVLGDSAKNTRSATMVVSEKGQNVRFVVDSEANISGKDGKATTLDKAAKGDKVVIEYGVTSQGALKVKSVKLVE